MQLAVVVQDVVLPELAGDAAEEDELAERDGGDVGVAVVAVPGGGGAADAGRVGAALAGVRLVEELERRRIHASGGGAVEALGQARHGPRLAVLLAVEAAEDVRPADAVVGVDDEPVAGGDGVRVVQAGRERGVRGELAGAAVEAPVDAVGGVEAVEGEEDVIAEDVQAVPGLGVGDEAGRGGHDPRRLADRAGLREGFGGTAADRLATRGEQRAGGGDAEGPQGHGRSDRWQGGLARGPTGRTWSRGDRRARSGHDRGRADGPGPGRRKASLRRNRGSGRRELLEHGPARRMETPRDAGEPYGSTGAHFEVVPRASAGQVRAFARIAENGGGCPQKRRRPAPCGCGP
ncbi:hypothetical protein [Nannocystis pusilla]|uniref:hypothetical protein n=1 Tax=Nannocystis pusilla TaxID=889268 RepID=UPI003DA2E3B1